MTQDTQIPKDSPQDSHQIDAFAAVGQERLPGGLTVLMGFIVLIVGAVVAVGLFGRVERVIQAQAIIDFSPQSAMITSPIDGALISLALTEGMAITKGQELARIEDPDLATEQAQAREEFWRLRAEIARLEAESQDTDPTFSDDLVAAAPATVRSQRTLFQLNRDATIAELKAATEEMNRKLAAWDETVVKVEEIAADLERLRKGQVDQISLPDQWGMGRGQWRNLSRSRQIAFLERRLTEARTREQQALATLAKTQADAQGLTARMRQSIEQALLDSRQALARADSALDALNRRQATHIIRAAHDGFVRQVFIVAPNPGLMDTDIATELPKGMMLAEVAYYPQSAPSLAYVPEADLDRINVGQRVFLSTANQGSNQTDTAAAHLSNSDHHSYSATVVSLNVTPQFVDQNLQPLYEVNLTTTVPAAEFSTASSIGVTSPLSQSSGTPRPAREDVLAHARIYAGSEPLSGVLSSAIRERWSQYESMRVEFSWPEPVMSALSTLGDRLALLN